MLNCCCPQIMKSTVLCKLLCSSTYSFPDVILVCALTALLLHGDSSNKHFMFPTHFYLIVCCIFEKEVVLLTKNLNKNTIYIWSFQRWKKRNRLKNAHMAWCQKLSIFWWFQKLKLFYRYLSPCFLFNCLILTGWRAINIVK